MSNPPRPEITSFPEDWTPPKDAAPDPLLYDESNEEGLLSYVEGSIKNAIESLDPKYFVMTENELRRHVNPDQMLCRVRLAFWDEFNSAVERKTKMRIRRLIKNCCSRDYFYKVILNNPNKLAWLATPPGDHMLAQREILETLVRKVSQIAKANIFYTDKDGTRRLDTKSATLVLNAYDKLHDKVFGSSVQRHAVAHAHAVAQVPGKESLLNLPSNVETSTFEQLEKLEAKMARIAKAVESNAPKEVEAEIVDEDISDE